MSRDTESQTRRPDTQSSREGVTSASVYRFRRGNVHSANGLGVPATQVSAELVS